MTEMYPPLMQIHVGVNLSLVRHDTALGLRLRYDHEDIPNRAGEPGPIFLDALPLRFFLPSRVFFNHSFVPGLHICKIFGLARFVEGHRLLFKA